MPQWPELPGIGAPAVSVEGIEEKAEVIEAEVPPPVQPSEDDELTRSHIARGLEAMHEGLFDQAQWEFEQARDLADDLDIVRIAQAQLDELHGAAAEVAQEQARPIRELAPQPIPDLVRPTDWNPIVRTGMMMGALNGVLTGCGAVVCLGFLLAPFLGFVAGWLIARQASTTRGDDRSPDAIHAITAGGITGLGGWLGEVIGHPIWLVSLDSSRTDPLATMLFTACVPGALYILLAVAASAVGWNQEAAKQHQVQASARPTQYACQSIATAHFW